MVPLLRRMTHLEKLTLSLRVGERNSFIDGTYLNNYILSQMPRLHTFHFDIVNEYVSINEHQPKPTPDDIRRTFTERGYHVDCYIDYRFYNSGRCHVYSLPFHSERMCHITHSFPGWYVHPCSCSAYEGRFSPIRTSVFSSNLTFISITQPSDGFECKRTKRETYRKIFNY